MVAEFSFILCEGGSTLALFYFILFIYFFFTSGLLVVKFNWATSSRLRDGEPIADSKSVM